MSPLLRAFLAPLVLLALFQPKSLAAQEGHLWQLSAEGRPASYLFASFPSSDPRVAGKSQGLLEALGGLRYLAVELVRAPEVREAMRKAMFSLPPGEARATIGNGLFVEAMVRADLRQLSSEDLMRATPWALYLLLSLPPSEYQRQREGALDQESALQLAAAERGLLLQTLQTAEERISALASLPEESQTALLRGILKPGWDAAGAFERYIELYLSGDLAGLRAAQFAALREEDEALEREVENLLIASRAELLSGRIAQAVGIAPGLFVINARLLPGPDGLLARLRERGLAVEPLRLPSRGN